jgi:DNA primase
MLDLRLAVDESVVGDGPVKIRCLNPNHDDPTASLAVYPTNMHCFGCGFHRNDWDECLSLLLGITVAEAHEVAPRYSSERLDAYREKAAQQSRRDPMPLAYAQMYSTFLHRTMTHRLPWLFDRGLTETTLTENLIGHTGTHWTIPVFDKDKRLLTIRFRRDDALVLPEYDIGLDRVFRVPKYQGWSGRNGLYLYGEHWLDGAEDVWLCEGELDALRLWQEGYPSCSPTNGARQCHKVPGILRDMLPGVRSVVVATDTDEAGDEAAVQTVRAANALGMRTYRAWWISQAKDVTEALANGDEIERVTV